MSDDEIFKELHNFVNGIGAAFNPLVNSLHDTVNAIADAFQSVFVPITARKRPYQTGKELAMVVKEHDLTAAERYPVRADREYHNDSIVLRYDDGSGFEKFGTYSYDALSGRDADD